MPLDAARLRDSIKSKLMANSAAKVKNSSGVAFDDAALTALCNEIATAVVLEITTNATVLPTALVAPPGTAGGPVTGTGKVS